MKLILGDSTEVMRQFKPHAFDGIFTDPPYNVSEAEVIGHETKLVNLDGRRNIRKHMGEWDEGFSPAFLVNMSAKLLAPGGWFVAFCSDRLIGEYQRLITENAMMYYKATITWIKSNPVPQIRQSSFLSGTEYIAIGIRGDENGNKIPPIHWNWLGQQNMKNYFHEPICSGNQRLYWHLDGHRIRPCAGRDCKWCQERGKDDKETHPAQKPIAAWAWLYRRLSNEGAKILDPFAGTGSSGMAATMYGLDWTGIEINEEYYTVANLWLNGKWDRCTGQIEWSWNDPCTTDLT